jgi:hypothetical protein
MTNSLVTNTLAVLAFMLAFYALLARERKTPYILNFLFPPAALLFVSIILESLSQVAEAMFAWQNPDPKQPQSTFGHFLIQTSHITHVAAAILFYFGVFWIAKNIWRLHNRQVNFRDDNQIKNLGIVRLSRNTWEKIHPKRSFTNNPEAVDQVSVRAVLQEFGFRVLDSSQIRTIASCGESLTVTDTYTTQMAAEFLRKGWLVQYTTCDRHPIEWVDLLRKTLVDEWSKLVSQLVVVDGYTPHFGFTDSIHARKSGKLKDDGVFYFATSESYAGVHTATAKAFNAFKKQAKQAGTDLRKPQFLIYEGCRALADLESPEQYRIFLRHVITSERMWGSMVTFFIEPESDDSDMKLISAYAESLRVQKHEREGSDGK